MSAIQDVRLRCENRGCEAQLSASEVLKHDLMQCPLRKPFARKLAGCVLCQTMVADRETHTCSNDQVLLLCEEHSERQVRISRDRIVDERNQVSSDDQNTDLFANFACYLCDGLVEDAIQCTTCQ